jgi:hypothetical protein
MRNYETASAVTEIKSFAKVSDWEKYRGGIRSHVPPVTFSAGGDYTARLNMSSGPDFLHLRPTFFKFCCFLAMHTCCTRDSVCIAPFPWHLCQARSVLTLTLSHSLSLSLSLSLIASFPFQQTQMYLGMRSEKFFFVKFFFRCSLLTSFGSKFARFFLVQRTKTGKKLPNDLKNITNSHETNVLLVEKYST